MRLHEHKQRIASVLPRLCLVGFLAGLLVAGCYTQRSIGPDWGFQTNGIVVEFEADSLLNRFDEEAHTLRMVVYQLSDTKTYKQLVTTQDGLRTLLAGGYPDPSFLIYQDFTIKPGDLDAIELDRSKDAQYVAVLTGYYSLQPGQVDHLFSIPTSTSKQGVFKNNTVTLVDQLVIEFIFGPDNIREVNVK